MAESDDTSTVVEFQTRERKNRGQALVAIDFHGDQIITFQHDGEPHVAMRRVVENIGIDWARQRQKLEGDSRFNCRHMPTVGADGKSREMLAMPVAKLPLWLATINPNKISDPAKRQKVEWYQAESAIVLHDYWTKGVAVRGDMDGLVTNLDPSVMRAIGGMVKGIVGKAVAELIPSMVQAEIGAHRYAIVEGVSALEAAEIVGYGVGMRPRGLTQFISRRLTRFHEDRGVPVRRSRHGSGKVKLFDETATRKWMSAGGKAETDAYVSERFGQGKLRLIGSRS